MPSRARVAPFVLIAAAGPQKTSAGSRNPRRKRRPLYRVFILYNMNPARRVHKSFWNFGINGNKQTKIRSPRGLRREDDGAVAAANARGTTPIPPRAVEWRRDGEGVAPGQRASCRDLFRTWDGGGISRGISRGRGIFRIWAVSRLRAGRWCVGVKLTFGRFLKIEFYAKNNVNIRK